MKIEEGGGGGGGGVPADKHTSQIGWLVVAECEGKQT